MNYTPKIMLKLLIVLTLITLPMKASSEVINTILAHVGNRIITLHDVQNLDKTRYMQALAIKDEKFRNEALATYIESGLDYLIEQNIILISAEREGVKVTDEEVNFAISDILTRNKMTEKQLDEALKKEDLSLQKYRLQLMNDILNSRVRTQVLLPKILVVDEELKEIVDENPDEYPFRDKYEIAMLLTKSKSDLNKALKEIEKGLPFSEAAKLYSVDNSASNGGDLGFLEVEFMNDSMRNAIISDKVGNISKPFEVNNQFGVFLVKAFKSKYDFDNETRTKLHNIALEKVFNRVFLEWLNKNRDTIVVMKTKAKK